MKPVHPCLVGAFLTALSCTLTSCTSSPDDVAQPHQWAESAIPEDAVSFGNSHYKVFEDTDRTLTWHQKKLLCEKMGGHLAVIETSEEQAFIAELADNRYLSLGATDEAVEDVWQWVNGAPWDESTAHWLEGQPNNYGDEEHYLATYDEGFWVDVAAEGHHFWIPTGYICEWD